jgi:hypothetical protein
VGTNETAQPRDVATAAYCRTFRGLFERCGVVGASDVEPSAAIALTSLSGQFAWHAELLEELLPHRSEIDREALIAVAAPGADDVLARLTSDGARLDASGLCVVLERVLLPRLRFAASSASPDTTAAFDGPRARASTLVDRDLADAERDLRGVVARRAATQRSVATSTELAALCEEDLGTAGVAFGLVTVNGGRWG